MKTEKELKLDQQYRIRAEGVADVMGRFFGSRNKKKVQAVLRKPAKWHLWVVSRLPELKQGKARKTMPNPILYPILWLFLLIPMLFYQHWHRHGWTPKQVEEEYRSGMMQYLKQKGRWIFDKLVDVKAVLRADSTIGLDPEYGPDYSRPNGRELDNLKTRTQETIISVLVDTPLDNGYPHFTAETAKDPRWQWLGPKSGDSPFRVLWKAFWKPFRAGLRGDFSTSRDINTHFTAMGIAKEQGYNTGRLEPSTKESLFSEGIVHKELKLKTDEGHTRTDIVDGKSGSFVDDIQLQMLLQKVFDAFTDPKDKATAQIYLASFANGTTIEEEHKRRLRKFQELGLRTPASVRQRMSRIPQKYPQLKPFNPYR